VSDTPTTLSDADVENLVRRSYQYVAMYNVNGKGVLANGGWNTVKADTRLKDHTLKDIARPNNDTLYTVCALDVRGDAAIIDVPAFDSDYASLMITGYDHYVNIPMSTRLGDFHKPEKLLVYSARTAGYDGAPVPGVDRVFEASGDFVSAIFRVMPHASDPERFRRITGQMEAVRLTTLSEFTGGTPKPPVPVTFPAIGRTDADVFANNLLEVMQFVFNHTTFDATNEVDRKVLAAYAPLGVVPGRTFDSGKVTPIDGARFREVAERVFREEMARTTDPKFTDQLLYNLFKPKGQISVDLLLFQSILGPIGMPASEAVYLPIATADGQPLNMQHDYVVRMRGGDEMPPAGAFWSVTLYDFKNGFFIPNERKKYSVGKNAGMQLDSNGGIAIYVAAEQPKGVPPENWLPIARKDEAVDLMLRLYTADLQKLKTWKPPVAERLDATTS
jgi:hypothetical protein